MCFSYYLFAFELQIIELIPLLGNTLLSSGKKPIMELVERTTLELSKTVSSWWYFIPWLAHNRSGSTPWLGTRKPTNKYESASTTGARKELLVNGLALQLNRLYERRDGSLLLRSKRLTCFLYFTSEPDISFLLNWIEPSSRAWPASLTFLL